MPPPLVGEALAEIRFSIFSPSAPKSSSAASNTLRQQCKQERSARPRKRDGLMPRAPLLGELSRQSPRLRGWTKAKIDHRLYGIASGQPLPVQPLLSPSFSPTFCYTDIYQKKVPPIKTVIYLDVLLLTNFALTLLFLLAAGLLAGVECRAGRLLLGGAAGALSSLALLAPEAPDAAALLYKVSTAAPTWPLPTAGPGADASPGLLGGSARKICSWRGRSPARGPDQQRLHLPAPLAGGTAGGRGRGGAGHAGGPPLSGPGRRAGIPRPAYRGRHSAGCPGLLRHRLFGAGAAFGPAVVLVRFGAVQSRLPPALGTYLEQHFAGAAPLPDPALGVRLVPCTTVAGHCILPAVPGQPVLHRLPAGQGRAEHLYAAFADLPPPPDGWEVLVGSETVSSLAHG